MTDNYGKISLGLGITSLILCFCCGSSILTIWIPILLAIIGIILGVMSKDSNGKTGMIIGVVSIVLNIIWLVAWFFLNIGFSFIDIFADPYMLEELIYLLDEF